jgi:hypothetical protein
MESDTVAIFEFIRSGGWTDTIFNRRYAHACGPGGVVGIAQATGWTVRGSNPGGGRDLQHLSRPAVGPTQPPV